MAGTGASKHSSTLVTSGLYCLKADHNIPVHNPPCNPCSSNEMTGKTTSRKAVARIRTPLMDSCMPQACC